MKRTTLVSRNHLERFLFALVAMGLVIAGFMASGKPAAGSVSNNRVMVLLNVDITDGLLAELSNYGTIHGWIDRYRLVAMTPHGRKRMAVIKTLPYVKYVERDELGELTDVGTWDRDIIDAVDVEETGFVGDPDGREVEQTGVGVHVAVIDTGLTKEWRDFLDESRVDTSLARSFLGGGNIGAGSTNEFKTSDPTNLWERDARGHGIAVASHIIGFNVGNLVVDGVAPGAIVIPIKVTDNNQSLDVFASRLIAAIAYVTGLVEDGVIGPTVMNISIAFPKPLALLEIASDDGIAAGIIVVAVAGNRGEQGMGWPGAFPKVISVGAVGLTDQFRPGSVDAPNIDFWWTQDVGFDPDRGRKGLEANEVYISPFSGRAIPDLVPGFSQELDVLAPGMFTVGPRSSIASSIVLDAILPGIFFQVGTSFSSPLTAGIVALILEKNPTLVQAEVEAILKATALPLKPVDSRSGIIQPFSGVPLPRGVLTSFWDTDCFGLPCDAVGAGLVQADDALAATPTP